MRLGGAGFCGKAMSDYLLREASVDAAADRIINELSIPAEHTDIRQAIEQMAQTTIQHQSMSFRDFGNLMQLIDFDFDSLYRHYVGKNVLNFFRQDHGYKDGSYVKVWNGREDNEHLSELLAELDSNSSSFRDDVYQGLMQRYPA